MEGLAKLGFVLLALAIIYSSAVEHATRPSGRSADANGVPWGIVLLLVAFGFVGRRWLAKRGKKEPKPRTWSRRGRALPPPPDDAGDQD